MKITRLSHAGAQVQLRRLTILLDPSSDGVPSGILLPPDVLLVTHAHRVDTALLCRLLAEASSPVTVLASADAYAAVRTLGGGHRYVLMRPHSVYSVGGVTFYAVHAEHGTADAVGFILDDGRQTCYAVGDTLYTYDVIDDVTALVEEGVDVALIPLGEEENTMHPGDAAAFLREIDAHVAVPLCFGPHVDGLPKAFDFKNILYLSPMQTQDVL